MQDSSDILKQYLYIIYIPLSEKNLMLIMINFNQPCLNKNGYFDLYLDIYITDPIFSVHIS